MIDLEDADLFSEYLNDKNETVHCVESVCIPNFSGPNAGKYGLEKFHIEAFFTQWLYKKGPCLKSGKTIFN